jgi:hypothetical protein
MVVANLPDAKGSCENERGGICGEATGRRRERTVDRLLLVSNRSENVIVAEQDELF